MPNMDAVLSMIKQLMIGGGNPQAGLPSAGGFPTTPGINPNAPYPGAPQTGMPSGGGMPGGGIPPMPQAQQQGGGLLPLLAQIGMSFGKYGGYRGQGMSDQMNRNRTLQMQQQQQANDWYLNQQRMQQEGRQAELSSQREERMVKQYESLEKDRQAERESEKARQKLADEREARATVTGALNDLTKFVTDNNIDTTNEQSMVNVASEIARARGLNEQQTKDLIRASARMSQLKRTPTSSTKRTETEYEGGALGSFDPAYGKYYDAQGNEVKNPKKYVAPKTGQQAQDDDKLISAILAKPEIYQSLTPKAKERLAPKLVEMGFDQLGKPLSDGAIQQVSQTKIAIRDLNELRGMISENQDLIGPITGLGALIPWSTEQKKLQAKVNAVKQRVGKALEGGVLRKEDEEKYKQILATLQDQPEVALSKIDNMLSSLEYELETFTKLQQESGRNVPVSRTAPAQTTRPPLSSFERRP